MTCADRAQKILVNFVADVKPTFSTALAESSHTKLADSFVLSVRYWEKRTLRY